MKKRTDQEMLAVLTALFDKCEESEAEIADELRALGYDPDEMGNKFAELAKAAIERARLNQFNEADSTLL